MFDCLISDYQTFFRDFARFPLYSPDLFKTVKPEVILDLLEAAALYRL